MKIKRSIFAAVGLVALTATVPSTAFARASVTLSIGSDYDEPYVGYDQYAYDDRDNYYDNGSYENDYYDDGAFDESYSDSDFQDQYSHNIESHYSRSQSCQSGTTGAILGAVVGGLLGREVGRGGYYDRPSSTGLIIGAGGGALAGRAIERNNCR